MQSRNQGNYRNPCLTMHQPWASLIVYGIKRIEGRAWPAPIRGCLWIHAASKVSDEPTIKAMEEFYREIYAVNGIAQTKFPEHYSVSRLQVLKLGIPFEMRGYQKIYKLEKKLYEAAARGLTIVESPLPVNFPLPNPCDLFSLKPGSLLLHVSEFKQSEPGKSSSLSGAIAGAQAAATQFSKNQNHSTSFSTRTSASLFY